MIDQRPASRQLTRLAGETVAYGLGSAATALVSIIAVPVLTRLLDPASYGTLDLFSTLLSILTVVTGLGLGGALVLYYRRADEGVDRREVARSALTLMTVSSVGVGAVGALVFTAVAAAAGQPAMTIVTGLLTFLWLPVNVMASGALDLLRSQFRVRSFAFLSVTRALAATLAGIVLVAVAGLDTAGVVGGQVVVGAAFTILTLVLIRGDLGGAWRPELARRMVSFGLPLVPAGIAAWTIIFSNRFFLMHFRSIDEVGVYALATRIAAVLTIATVAINSAWSPFAVEEARHPRHRATYARAVAFISAGLVLAATALGLAAPEIVSFAAPAAYAGASAPVGILALGAAMGSIAGIVAIGLQLTERTAGVAIAAGIAAAVSIGLNLVLVPTFGIMGAAVAGLAALTVQAAVTLAVAQRQYPVPYHVGALVATVLTSLLALTLGLAGEGGVIEPLRGTVARVGLLAVASAVMVVVNWRAIRAVPG